MATPKIFKWALPLLLTLTASPTGGEVLGEDRDRLTFDEPVVRQSIKNDISPPLRDLIIQPSEGALDFREIPLRPLPRSESPIVPQARTPAIDPAIQTEIGPLLMPLPTVSFEGIRNSDNPGLLLPPDTNGDVGPNHYVQMMNIVFRIWDKSGTPLLEPFANNSLWIGFGGLCQTTNQGDPIVLYDQLADRWLMSQFAFDVNGVGDPIGPFHQCIAISQTPDPTGSWNLYDFEISATKLNDYPKFGIWPDGYYMTVNQFNEGTFSWGGAGVVAFERDQMLLGQPAQMVYFDLFGVDPDLGGMLPSDLDGTILPPVGSPNYFLQVDDNNIGFPQDQLEIWEFNVDWVTPGNSTFSGPDLLPTASFDSTLCNFSRNCIPQRGTTQRVDAISDRLMFRLAYRNFGTHESLVANHTVDADGSDHAGVRWYELRDSGGGWIIENQGTYAPDPDHRWMGSIAMDQDGNIALGYSVSSSTTFPSIRYTGRLVDDPADQLSQGEAEMIAGSGSQTDPAARWGDYSMMAVDPVDDCTFWYTQEYYETTSDRGWQTRIGSFKFPSCGKLADLSLTKSDSPPIVIAGTNLTYTIIVTNGGPDDATNVTLTDTLPPSVSFVSANPDQGSCGESGGVVTCDFGGIDNGNTAMVDIIVIPNLEGLITNTATVTADAKDPDTGNNTVMEDTTVNPAESDLSVTKVDSLDPAFRDTNLSYTVSVTNNGPSNATGVTLTDTLPGTVTFVSATPDQESCNEAGGTVTCNLGDINTGVTVDVTIVVTPTLETMITNTVIVSGNENDLIPGNNSDTEDTDVSAVVNFSIVKVDSPDPVVAGNNLSYIVTATNNGPSVATGVTLTDTLPSGPVTVIAFVSALPDKGSCFEVAGEVTCNLGTFNSGEDVLIEIEITPISSGFIMNTATISSIEDPIGITDIENTDVTGISAAPTSYFFGSVLVGSSSNPQTFTIRNNVDPSVLGNTDLMINPGPILPTGANSGDFEIQNDNCSGKTLAAQDTCTIDAVFSPGSPGPKTAILPVSSTDPIIPTLNIPLSGTQVHTLTINKIGTGGGTVSSTPPDIQCGSTCFASFESGAGVTLATLPDTGSTFVDWTGDPDCSDGNVTITGDIICTATFDLTQHTLSVGLEGNGLGVVTSNPAGIDCETDCSEDYTFGTDVGLTAFPGNESNFSGWSGDCTGNDITVTVSMTSAASCTATFTLKTFTLSVSIAGIGTGTISSDPSGIDCGNDCAQSYSLGTEVKLTVLPDGGFTFTGWSGDPDCTDGKVIMTSDISCTANLSKAGDVDGSGRVDGFDLGRLGLAFGSQEGDPNWNPDADLNGDGRVDDGDVQILRDNFGSSQ